MKTAIFISVRTDSKRLPNKALIEIQSIPTIVHLIRRMKKVQVDHIVLCTTLLKEDDILCDIASKEGIVFFRGSTKDKLDRWKGAAAKFGIEFFVTADGDDLFCSSELIRLAINQYILTKPDFIENLDIICGAFTYGIKVEALNKVCDIKNSEDTEMMWTYFKDTGLFEVQTLRNVPLSFIRSDIRMTLDYKDDLTFFQKIIDHFFENENIDYTLDDIISYLNENPEIIKINSYLHEEWKRNQIMKTQLSLKVNIN
jgi:spore coat polysaccharide biosynthesis protein SpsF